MSTIFEISLGNNKTEIDYKHFNKKTKGRTLMEMFTDFFTTPQDSGKFVSLTNRPSLPQVILLVLFSVRG